MRILDQPMVSPPVLQGSTDHTPNHAQSLVSSGHAYRPSLLSSKGLSLPVSHDENAHHVVPCNPCLVAPSTSKDKLNPSTKKLYGCDPVPPDLTASHLCRDKPPLTKTAGPIGKKTCRACAAPNRYFIPCHELLPKFLSQTDMSADVLRESDLLQETVSDVSEYMFHEANNPIDSGYHSPEPMVPANRDASSNSVSMVPVSAMKVPCPFPKGGTLVDLPCNKNEVLSPVLCKDMGCPDVKFPGQVLSLASTLRVRGENLTNAGSIWASLGKLETFEKPNYSTPCNCIVGPIEEKVLPSPMEFPAQSMVASHPSGVDGYSEDSVSEAPIYVQSTSAHNHAITSPDEPLNWPRLILMAKKSAGLPTSGNTFHPKRQSFKEGRRKYKWNFIRPPKQKVYIQNELDLPHVHQTNASAFEWNLPRPPNFEAPNEKDLAMHHDKVGGKSYSWDFHLAPSASIPSCHSSL